MGGCDDVRFGRVGVQVDALEGQDVVFGVLAVLEWVLAGHGERVIPWREGGGAGEEG